MVRDLLWEKVMSSLTTLMYQLRKSNTQLAGLCLCLGALSGCSGTRDEAAEIARMGRTFLSSRDPELRMQICIQAIDRHYISIGSNVSVLEKLFGKELSRLEPDGKRLGQAGVLFIPGQNDKGNTPNDTSVRGNLPYVGWYLQCYYNFRSEIKYFYLTNILLDNLSPPDLPSDWGG